MIPNYPHKMSQCRTPPSSDLILHITDHCLLSGYVVQGPGQPQHSTRSTGWPEAAGLCDPASPTHRGTKQGTRCCVVCEADALQSAGHSQTQQAGLLLIHDFICCARSCVPKDAADSPTGMAWPNSCSKTMNNRGFLTFGCQ